MNRLVENAAMVLFVLGAVALVLVFGAFLPWSFFLLLPVIAWFRDKPNKS